MINLTSVMEVFIYFAISIAKAGVFIDIFTYYKKENLFKSFSIKVYAVRYVFNCYLF